MTVRRFSFCAAFISVLCVIALTFGSCGVSDISKLVGDILTTAPQYSYSMFRSAVDDYVLRQSAECTITCSYDGDFKELINIVNNDVDRLFAEDEYVAYYVRMFRPSYTHNANNVQIKCKLAYNDFTVPGESIIDADKIDLHTAYAAAKILQTGEQTVAFHSANGFDNDEIQSLVNTVSINSGTAYTFSEHECYIYPNDNGKILQISYLNNIPKEKRAELNKKLYDKVSEIAAKIAAENEGENKKRMCLAIHNYICENTRYDYDIMPESVTTDEAMIGRSAYGALIGGKTVCSGYSSAFYLLYNEIIGDGECKIVAGKQGEGDDAVGHAWNVVYDNGEQYYIDCTFDDHDDDGYGFDYFYEPTDSDNFKHHIIEKDYILE